MYSMSMYSGESNTYTDNKGRRWAARPLASSVPAAKPGNFVRLPRCKMWLSKKDVEEENNRRVDLHPDAKVFDKNGFLPWVGKLLGEGAYGAVFGLTFQGEAKRRLLACLKSMTHVTLGSVPTQGQRIAVKFIIQGKKRTRKEWVQECYREACVLQYLHQSGCMSPHAFTKPVCASDHVPPLFFSGMLLHNMYVMVMGWAQGKPLADVIEKQHYKLTAEQYVAIERAVASMWLNGIVHADLHDRNLLVDSKTKQVTIIDTGFAQAVPIFLRVPMRDKLLQLVKDGGRTLGDVFTSDTKSPYYVRNLQPAVNRMVKHTKGHVPYYNNDATFLRSKYKLVEDKDRIPDARKASWGWSKSRVASWWFSGQ